MTDCIFCKIVSKEFPCYQVWEDDSHLAFLTPFPNTEGFTVVVPKKHYSSYAFDMEDTILANLVLAAKKVAKKIDAAYAGDVARTGLIFEGFGVDHLHAKLIPMHGTANSKEWIQRKSSVDKYFEYYEGYLSSHDHVKADHNWLLEVANKIKSA